MQPLFITGIGTNVGKTFVAAVITEALHADYWKPIQAGFADGTDSEWVRSVISNERTTVHRETYKLKLPASPHIAAIKENQRIDLSHIIADHRQMNSERPLIIEGAGGLMVPLNDDQFVIDLIQALNAKVILVSRNYLGSINHSLLTAKLCRSARLDVAGWVFNDQFMDYEQDIVGWTGYPRLFSLPFCKLIDRDTVRETARGTELGYLCAAI